MDLEEEEAVFFFFNFLERIFFFFVSVLVEFFLELRGSSSGFKGWGWREQGSILLTSLHCKLCTGLVLQEARLWGGMAGMESLGGSL